MQEMIKRVREDKGGFTLAELLVVVAIIAIMIAIAIPVFTAATDEATTATAEANIRAVEAASAADALTKKVTIGAGQTIYYEGTITRNSTSVTNVQSVTASGATSIDDVKKWLKKEGTSAETLTIVVPITDSTKATTP